MPSLSEWRNLVRTISEINRKVDVLMSGLSDLTSAEAQETADISTLISVVGTLITDLKAALANTDSDAAVEAASLIVAQQDAQLQAITAQLKAADPGAPATPPASN